MLRKVKRRCRPTTLMLVLGFAISMTAVLIGISVIHDLLESLASAGQEAPILQTIQNSGLSLALRIYLFSMVNCMTAANFWVITRRRDLAVCKAFGWSGSRIIGAGNPSGGGDRLNEYSPACPHRAFQEEVLHAAALGCVFCRHADRPVRHHRGSGILLSAEDF